MNIQKETEAQFYQYVAGGRTRLSGVSSNRHNGRAKRPRVAGSPTAARTPGGARREVMNAW